VLKSDTVLQMAHHAPVLAFSHVLIPVLPTSRRWEQ